MPLETARLRLISCAPRQLLALIDQPDRFAQAFILTTVLCGGGSGPFR